MTMRLHSAVFVVVSIALIRNALFVNAFAPITLQKQQQRNAFPTQTRDILPPLYTATVDIKANDLITEAGVLERKHEDDAKFNWNKAWYPLVPIEILDREQPHRFQLLGENIVVWNDGPVTNGLFQSKKSRTRQSKRTSGTWRAFVDECPHRKVPLSEGRVEDDGTLLCSYHAWRFDGNGACVNIPQMDKTSKEYSRIINNPKSNCNSYPTKVVDGLLFVWPSSDTNAVLESTLTALPLPKGTKQLEEMDDGVIRASNTESTNHKMTKSKDDTTWYGPWNFRELPYGADYFLENVVDPAHVTVSHHNVVGNRYKVEPMVLKTSTSLSKDGFAIQQLVSNELPGGTTSFIAPGLVTVDVSINGAKQTLELYASPSRPGFCNHIGRMVIQKNEKGEMPPLLRTFTLPMPIWLNHVLASAFLNQDALFLHHQERHLATSGQYSTVVPETHSENGMNDSSSTVAASTNIYKYNQAIQAAPSDLGVINFRNWVRVFAGGRIPYRNNQVTMPASSNEVVFDVWNAHTKYCRYCQDALKRLKVARLVSYMTAAVMAITRPWGMYGTLVSSFTLAGIGLLLNKLIGMFYRYEFSHAHND
jgi:phenylpropionate dioxygenase-like ring-hydroxylating dioxygenase large terminal subunit